MNYFIVIDGIDGSGKSEMLDKLGRYLTANKHYRILLTREPSTNIYGKRIRQFLKRDNDPRKNAGKMLDLYVKDRERHLNREILPFLRKKGMANIVLCDRYYYSTIAYQHAQGIPLKKLIQLNKGFLKPDLAIILDIPVGIALKRISKVRKKQKFEQLAFMEKVRKNFLALKNYLKDNIVVVDSSKAKRIVFAKIKKELDKILD